MKNAIDVYSIRSASFVPELGLIWSSDSPTGRSSGDSGRLLSVEKSSHVFPQAAGIRTTSEKLVRIFVKNSSHVFLEKILSLASPERQSTGVKDPIKDYSGPFNLRPLEQHKGTPALSAALEVSARVW